MTEQKKLLLELKGIVKELEQYGVHSFDWESLLIDYHAPVIHRLINNTLDSGNTLFLQKIYPIGTQPTVGSQTRKALMHSHSWDFALKVLKGGYEMGVGVSLKREYQPEAMMTIDVLPGSYYSFGSELLFHYTKPFPNEPSYSVMLVGPRKRERMAKNNNKLTPDIKDKLIAEFAVLIAGDKHPYNK